MSCSVPLTELVKSNLQQQESSSSFSSPSVAPNDVTSVCFAPNGAAVLIGEKNGLLSCLENISKRKATMWSVNAQCGAISGITCASPSSSAQGALSPALVAVFGHGDSAVNVFSVEMSSTSSLVAAAIGGGGGGDQQQPQQQQSKETGAAGCDFQVQLRWRCTGGHLFGVSAASLCWSAQTALLFTCGRDGHVQMFDIHRNKSSRSNNNSSSGQVATVSPMLRLMVPEAGYVPVAIAPIAMSSSSSSSITRNTAAASDDNNASAEAALVPFDQRGNVIVVCEKQNKKNASAAQQQHEKDSDLLFLELDALALQRANSTSGLLSMMMHPTQQQNFGLAAASSSIAHHVPHQPHLVQKFFLSELLEKLNEASTQRLGSSVVVGVDAVAWNPASRSLFLARGNANNSSNGENNSSRLLLCIAATLPQSSVLHAGQKSIPCTVVTAATMTTTTTTTTSSYLSTSPYFATLRNRNSSSSSNDLLVLQRWSEELLISRAVEQQQTQRATMPSSGLGNANSKKGGQGEQKRKQQKFDVMCRNLVTLSLVGARRERDDGADYHREPAEATTDLQKEILAAKQEIEKLHQLIQQVQQLR